MPWQGENLHLCLEMKNFTKHWSGLFPSLHKKMVLSYSIWIKVIHSFSKTYLPQICHAYFLSWSCFSVLLEWPACHITSHLSWFYQSSNVHLYLRVPFFLGTFTSHCPSLIYSVLRTPLLIFSFFQKYDLPFNRTAYKNIISVLNFFQITYSEQLLEVNNTVQIFKSL